MSAHLIAVEHRRVARISIHSTRYRRAGYPACPSWELGGNRAVCASCIAVGLWRLMCVEVASIMARYRRNAERER